MNQEALTSKQNSQIKKLHQLAMKKYRQELGEFCVENLAIILDGLRSGAFFEALYITQAFVDKHKDQFSELLKGERDNNIFLVSEDINCYSSQLETPSGIVAVYKIKADNNLTDSSVLYLDNVGDPGNVGTIMRSCLAFGVDNIVLSDNCADIYNSKTISAAKDSIFKLNVVIDKTGDWIVDCKSKMPIYTADSGGGVSLDNFVAAERYCLVMGSESHGVRQDITDLASAKIKINISPNMESLNVATAAAIFLYKLSRK